MNVILDHIDQKSAEYSTHPLFLYLRDEAKPPGERLKFVPSLAHFVMSFADIYAHVLRHEPPQDHYQELVNAHTYEDGGHWKWFLADLKTLGQDPTLHFSEALRLIWGDRTAQIRMLTYRMCRLGLGANTLEKLVLVHCIEAGGKTALSAAVSPAVTMARQLGRDLLYFGTHHLNTEIQHTLEDAGVHESLQRITLDPATRAPLLAMVDQSFVAFAEFADGVLEFTRAALVERSPTEDR